MGASVGLAVGSAVGAAVGSAVGAAVGSAVGSVVGSAVGSAVGQCFGDSDAFDGFAGFKIKMGLPGGRFLGAAADANGRAVSHSRADGLKMQIIHGISSS